MLRDDFPECPQCFVNRFSIGEHSGDIVVEFNMAFGVLKSSVRQGTREHRDILPFAAKDTGIHP